MFVYSVGGMQNVPLILKKPQAPNSDIDSIKSLEEYIEIGSSDTLSLASKLINLLGSTSPISNAELNDLNRAVGRHHTYLKSVLLNKISKAIE